MDGVRAIPQKLGSLLSSIWDTIKNLPESIINGLKDLLVFLFVPEEGFFDGKVDEISAKFGFIESIRDTVNVFVNYFENVEYNEAPVVTLNLSSAKSSYDYGQKAVAISMEWYKPYKATGDAIISAIIWLVFLWNVFTGLPSLISGVGSGMRAAADISEAQTRDVPRLGGKI